MQTTLPASEVAARERVFDDAVGAPLTGYEAALARQTARENEERRRTKAARAILRIALADITFSDLLGDPTRGEVAAKLFATWALPSRSEPVIETRYADADLYADLRAAMNAHGLSTFDGRCQDIGKRIVMAAIDYVLSCHERDVNAITEQWNDERELEADARSAAAEEYADGKREGGS